MQEVRIAIVGAGPAGLTAALAAQRQGFSVSLFERMQEPRRIEGGVLLHSNGLRVLAALGLLDSFLPGVRPVQRVLVETPDGRCLSALDYSRLSIPQNRAALALRHHLQTHLLAAVEESGVTIRYGHRLTGLVRAAGVAHLRFENGHSDTFDVVVAADGIDSRTREFAGLAARRRTGDEAFVRGICSIDLRDGDMREIWGPDGRRFGICPMKGERAYFYCSFPRGGWERIRSGIAEREAWIQTWDGFSGTAVSVLRATDDWSTVSYSETAEIHLDRWYRPPVFVIGDAAHAMSPHLGQGVNSAMVDALVLMRILGRLSGGGENLETAGRLYEALRRPFVQRLQTASRRTGRLTRWNAPLRATLLSLARALPYREQNAALLAAGYNPLEGPYLTWEGGHGKLCRA